MASKRTGRGDEYVLICRPYITTRSGKRIFAHWYGKKAFCFYVKPK